MSEQATDALTGGPPPVLEAVGLTKRFQKTIALDALDLAIRPGEVFCLLGANGAGKTTTINLFLGFVTPNAGVARIGGMDVVAHPLATKQIIAYIPEQVTLYRNLTGRENLEYFMALSGRDRLGRSELRAVFEQVGLPPGVAEQRVGTYSKGMRQKVGIAIALAKRAQALLLDEPTSGLDPQAANEFSTLLARMSGEGAAVLMATHDLFRAKEAGTRIGIMRQGRLVATLSADEIGYTDLERIYLEHMRG
jgi:ABC-2 type transport system ATP-binding protein